VADAWLVIEVPAGGGTARATLMAARQITVAAIQAATLRNRSRCDRCGVVETVVALTMTP
jgi:hypothetical protein